MKRIQYFLVFVIVILLCGLQCKKDQAPLFLMNNSDRSLYIYINNSWPGVGPVYPDTTLWGQTIHGYPLIRPHTKQSFDDLLGKRGEKTYEYLGDTLSFVIFDADTISKYSWDIINKEYKIVQRYDLSIYDLQKLDYTLYYPPSETMRNMKMFPPFGDSK